MRRRILMPPFDGLNRYVEPDEFMNKNIERSRVLRVRLAMTGERVFDMAYEAK